MSDDYKAKYAALLSAIQTLPGGDPKYGADPIDLVRHHAKESRVIWQALEERGERFLIHFGYENWAENVIARMSDDPSTAIRGASGVTDAIEQAKRGTIH